jgi:hypothetical protein
MSASATRFLSVLVVGGLLAACHKQPITPPITPSPVPAPGPSLPSIPQTGHTLSGLVFESTVGGPRAVADGFVDYLVDTGSASGRVSLDTNGRYTIPNLHDGSRIRVTALAAFGNGELEQKCGAYALVSGDTVRDVELVRAGTPGRSQAAPTLSGVVYYTATGGRRPLAQTRVLYYSVYKGTFDVYTTTDSDGRYEVCGLPLGSGCVGAGDCNDAVLQVPVEIRGDATVLDVDLTSLIRECPGVVIPTGSARRE